MLMWGGQAKLSNLIMLESIAVAVTLFFGFVIAVKTGYINVGKFAGVVNVLVWIVFAFLLLNTLGILPRASRLRILSWLPYL